MRIVKVGVLAPTNKGISLGVQGENRATQVEFDTRPWFREYPSGTVSAVARRYGDPAPYPLTLDVDDGTAVWHVSDTDTAKAGEGAVELTMTSAGARVRSLTFKTLVTASLTDSPVDDDAWYGWLDKAVVKVDETVQSAQRKMAEVDDEWTGLKVDVTEKVDECAEVAAQAASDAHHAKVDAQATAKALESAEGSVAKAEAAASRAVDAALAADDSAVEASRSALSAGDSAEAARLSADAAANSAGDAASSASDAADAASAASGSASAAEQSATDASNAKAAAQTAKADAATSASNAATSASNAESSATAAAKSASDAAASVGAINVIAPKTVSAGAVATGSNLSIGNNAQSTVGYGNVAIGYGASSKNESVAIGDAAISASDNASNAVSIGHHSRSQFTNSIALGASSVCEKTQELSIGRYKNDKTDEMTREITHVSTPTADTSAATKKYTDDNDTKTLTEAKKYTDDNDVKTLSEAKKYTDANTSNALVGTVSGKLLHVEDAWPGKPLGLTIDGAYKQDGTPSPDNPVPITVIENPVLKVTGRNLVNVPDMTVPINDVNGKLFDCALIPNGTTAYLSVVSSNAATSMFDNAATCGLSDGTNNVYSTGPDNVAKGINRTRLTPKFDATKHLRFFGYRKASPSFDLSNYQLEVGGYHDYRPYTSATLTITLPAEHPYLAALPDGTHDEIVIDKDGNASLVARVWKVFDFITLYEEKAGGADFQLSLKPPHDVPYHTGSSISNVAVQGNVDSAEPVNGGVLKGVYVRFTRPDTVVSLATAKEYLRSIGAEFYVAVSVEHTYSLGKITVPSLPETISNVWTDAELTTNMSMTYKRDINIAFDNLAQAVVAAAAGE